MIPPGGEPEGLGLAVELPPEEARLRSCRSSRGIDPHSLHRRKVDVLAREPDGGLDIGDTGKPRDELGMTIDGAPPLVRALPTWLRLSAFAGVGRVGAAVAGRPA